MGYLRQFGIVHFSWTGEPAVAWFSFPPLQTQMALSFKPLVVDKFLFANAQCSLREHLEILEIYKKMAEILLNFDKKNYYYNFGWCRTVKRLQEKYFLQIFVKNGSYISKKNMKRGSDKHGIWCVGQSDRAE